MTLRLRHLTPPLVLLLAFASAPITARANEPPASPPCAITGIVVDQSGLPLPGVVVWIGPADVAGPPDDLATTTQADGRFAWCSVPDGPLDVRATLDGFRLAGRVSVQGGATPQTLSLVMQPAIAEQIVVTATRTRVALTEVPVRTEVVPTEAIALLRPRTLADALAFTPGVRVEDNCQTCNFSQVRLLGLDGAYTQFLLDGQPVVSSLAQVYGVEQIPARMVERVEIVKGGGSALYGSGSVGGVVNVIPREPARSGAAFSVQSSAIDGRTNPSVDGVADWVNADRTTLVSAYGQADRLRAYDFSGDGFTEIGKRRFEAAGARAAQYLLAGRGKLTADVHWMHEYRRGGDALDRPETEAEITERADTAGLTSSLVWFQSVSRAFDYRVSAAHATTDRDTYYGAGGDPNAFGTSASTMLVLDSQLNHYTGRHVLSWGVQHSRERLVDEQPAYDRTLDETYTNTGVFVQDSWSFRPGWELLSGLRFDKHSALARAGVSPRVAVMWSPRPALTFRANASTGFRAPQVFDEDLHINAVNGESIIITNAPDLEKESSTSVLAGAEWRPDVGMGQALFEVNVFHTRLERLFFVRDADIEATPIREFERTNLGGATVRGVEVNLGWGIGDRVIVQGGLVRQQARYDDPEPDFGSRDFYRTPRTSLLGLASWKAPMGDVLVAARYHDGMLVPHYAGYIDEDRLERTPGFFELDASIARRLHEHVTLLVTGKNLTNAFQRDFDQGPRRDSGYIYGPRFPRSIGVALKVEF